MFNKIRQAIRNKAYTEEGVKLNPTDQARVESLEAEYKLLGAKRKELFQHLAKTHGLKGENDISVMPKPDGLYLKAQKAKPNEKTPKPADSGNNKSGREPGTDTANAEGKGDRQNDDRTGAPKGTEPHEAPNPPGAGADRKAQ